MMVAMFFSPPAPKSTVKQQRTAAVVTGSLLGLAPLVIGIGLLLAAQSAKRELWTPSTPVFGESPDSRAVANSQCGATAEETVARTGHPG